MPHPILVIEDNAANRELLSSLLEAHGYGVIQATTAQSGIDLARSAAPQLILMDLSLPGMSGLEATRQLKSDPGTTHVPVIAVSAHAFDKDRAAAMAAGCCGFITKPIDTRRMIVEIAGILRTHRLEGTP
ncbi:MAG: response regulator [Planctomycetes bacterium]|nr:response regulator [Planctomycetota bacterium]